MDLIKKTAIFIALACILAACNPAAELDSQTSSQIGAEVSPGEAAEIAKTEDEPASELEQGPDCLGPELNEIGQGIADHFDATNYDEVMTWFCNGAEFEDILLALQSEEQSDVQVEEMLLMLADGFTWDEIWQLLGMTE